MIPLQAATDPIAMGVVVLSVVMVFVILFSFIWAFGKIRDGPDLEHDLKEPGRPRV
ncbi:hypothetical protein HWV07_17215 [Natronomonas salina]|uniref:hypothetical protein n=1 Tax=Natronomonas salina TaxID=1710540 RepID=UPI0015B45477|nr:hypothetical protein [Natronomonas salina]QLD90688.1 hypothetical protein HWV07_17215 [Natronomonas salina]